MRKKNCFIILTICFCILSAVNVLAGDVPESVVTDKNADAATDTGQNTMPSFKASIIPDESAAEPVQQTVTNKPLLMVYGVLLALIVLAAGGYLLYEKITEKNKPKRNIKKGK